MSAPRPPPLPPPASRDIVLHARRLASEYRLLSAFDEELYIPRPAPWEEAAYGVLLQLEMLDPTTYQWSTRGRAILALSDTRFNSIFSRYLDQILRSTNSSTVPIVAKTSRQSDDSEWFETELFHRSRSFSNFTHE